EEIRQTVVESKQELETRLALCNDYAIRNVYYEPKNQCWYWTRNDFGLIGTITVGGRIRGCMGAEAVIYQLASNIFRITWTTNNGKYDKEVNTDPMVSKLLERASKFEEEQLYVN